jgi:adenine-specific DNA-methyltransferase
MEEKQRAGKLFEENRDDPAIEIANKLINRKARHMPKRKATSEQASSSLLAVAVARKGTKERRFLEALRNVFVGATVSGQSGYINLMHIKASYFTRIVEPALVADVEAAVTEFPDFREELFDKLHAFFSRYFSKSGSICFAYTPNHMSVYEKIYTDEEDVVLFWKTHMLYFVKTDRLFRDLRVEVDGHAFFFDCSNLQHKKANEKRSLVFAFDKVEKDTVHLGVTYSERGRITKTDDILKALKKAQHPVTEAVLDKAMQVFARQSEVDYFINKDAANFLREQFDLWMYQYIFKDETHWTDTRVRQLQALKDIAFRLITFIAQFEDELVRIWNKPKFVRGSHYLITLDRIAAQDGGVAVIDKLLKHPGMKEQVADWNSLSIVEASFKPAGILEGKGKDRSLAQGSQSLPIDTIFFKSLELDILGLFPDLDQAIDGRLIKSENYQALNMLREKFKGRIKMVYIDPPYNTGQDEFIYEDNLQSASWLSMMQDRLRLSQGLLAKDGALAVSIDENEISNCLRSLDDLFTRENRVAIPTVKRGSVTGHKAINPGLVNVTEYAPMYAADRAAWKPQRLYRERPRNERYNRFIINRQDPYSSWRFTTLLDAFAEHTGLQKSRLRRELGNKFESKIFEFICANRDSVIQLARPDADKVSKEVQKAIARSKKERDCILHIPREGDSDFYLINGERILFYADRLREVDGKLVTVEPMSDIWDDVVPNDLHNEGGVTLKKGKKPEKLLLRLIDLCTENAADIVLDYCAGTGTSVCVAQKRGRKWVGVEMAEHFDSKMLVRVKNVLAGDGSGVSTTCKWKGGGFVKCFALEQYEEAIGNAVYAGEEDLFRNTKRDPYSQYVFLRDEKMARALDLDYKKDTVGISLDRLYPDVDLAETLSCVTGKWIKRVAADEVEFADGTKESLMKPDWRILKPLIFWGPSA